MKREEMSKQLLSYPPCNKIHKSDVSEGDIEKNLFGVFWKLLIKSSQKLYLEKSVSEASSH